MKKLFIIFIGILPLLFVWNHQADAVTSDGSGSVKLSPSTKTLPIGQESTLQLLFNTNNTSISSLALRLTFPSNANDLEVLSITPDSTLLSGGWSFPIKSTTTTNGITTIDIAALNISVTGYQNATDTPLATLKIKANSNFTGKTISFDTTQSKMLKKEDASDMLSAPASGSVSTTSGGSGGATITTPSATPTPTVKKGTTGTPTSQITITTTQQAERSITTTPNDQPTNAPLESETAAPTVAMKNEGKKQVDRTPLYILGAMVLTAGMLLFFAFRKKNPPIPPQAPPIITQTPLAPPSTIDS